MSTTTEELSNNVRSAIISALSDILPIDLATCIYQGIFFLLIFMYHSVNCFLIFFDLSIYFCLFLSHCFCCEFYLLLDYLAAHCTTCDTYTIFTECSICGYDRCTQHEWFHGWDHASEFIYGCLHCFTHDDYENDASLWNTDSDRSSWSSYYSDESRY